MSPTHGAVFGAGCASSASSAISTTHGAAFGAGCASSASGAISPTHEAALPPGQNMGLVTNRSIATRFNQAHAAASPRDSTKHKPQHRHAIQPSTCRSTATQFNQAQAAASPRDSTKHKPQHRHAIQPSTSLSTAMRFNQAQTSAPPRNSTKHKPHQMRTCVFTHFSPVSCSVRASGWPKPTNRSNSWPS